VRQFNVAIEGRFILQARVCVEQQWIACGAIWLDRPTAWLRAGRSDDIALRGRNFVLQPSRAWKRAKMNSSHRLLRWRYQNRAGANIKPR
jgi:hypothetical protein